uniref:Transmembrane protein 79a n=1 Tax=Oryzias latipes TaxID=8090 RepID=A0A3P9J7G2_ORYLA
MSTSGLQATNHQNAKELDSMKESISDIINQLQDIDPTRLSFSPFLDLDTQISLAPVSDSPESSVEELRSSSHSVSGSQLSLEQPAAQDQPRSSALQCHQQRRNPGNPRAHQSKEGETDQRGSSPVLTVISLEATVENCTSPQTPASQGDIPNGTDPPRWSPESNTLDCTVDEVRPLISPPPESVELTVWSSGGQADAAAEEASDRGRCCCLCTCCRKGRLPALLSALASLLCAAGILYAFYVYVPIRIPECPSTESRIVFALCCCVVASLPILLAMLGGAACQFCSGSLDVPVSLPRRQRLQQLFITASLELLLLYVLNLILIALIVPQEQLKVVPMVVTMFIIGRLVYWFSLNTCSSWRGFGSGLTFFPLLAIVALNLFLMYQVYLKAFLSGSQDVLYNQVTPSPWSGETSHSPSGKPDILDAQ